MAGKTSDEINLCRDHALEVEERTPANPVNPKLFTDAKWKAVQNVRGPIAEKVTGNKSGKLSLDPTVFERQVALFEEEIVEQGWPVQGKESCRIFWGMLTNDHRSILKHTNCYAALRNEKFKENVAAMPPAASLD